MLKRIFPQLILAFAVMVLTTIFQPLRFFETFAQPGSQGNCQTFKETGKTVCGKFLTYWQQHGGLAQQGYPISGEFTEVSEVNGKPYTVQYFERAVFELHPEEKPPYDVLLSQLGRIQFGRRYPSGDPPTVNRFNWPIRLRLRGGCGHFMMRYQLGDALLRNSVLNRIPAGTTRFPSPAKNKLDPCFEEFGKPHQTGSARLSWPP